MTKSKRGTSEKGLVKSAINLDLNNGYVLCVSEDGERISRKCIWGIPYEVADITEESFLQALGFTIDKSEGLVECYETRAFNIVVNLFTFIEDIKVSNLKKLVKAFEEVMSDHSGINFKLGVEPLILSIVLS